MVHLLGYNVIDISSGLTHSVALGYPKITSEKIENIAESSLKLLVWGEGVQGATGIGSREDIYIPTENKFFEGKKTKEAYCGYSHTLVWTGKI